MKPLTSCVLKIRIKNLNNEFVEKIQFLFRFSKNRNSNKIIEKLYGSEAKDVTYDSEKDLYLLYFTPKETDLFPEDSIVWLDIRPIFTDGSVVPVELLKIKTTATLFTRSDTE